MSKIKGRIDDMMTYGGANVYTDMFYKTLDPICLSDKFQVVMEKDQDGLMDQLTIRIESNGNGANHDEDEISKMIETGLRKHSGELEYVFSHDLVKPILVEFVKYGNLYKGTGKFNRFIDQRTI